MAKVWLNQSGKVILRGGKVLVCDECPCGGGAETGTGTSTMPADPDCTSAYLPPPQPAVLYATRYTGYAPAPNPSFSRLYLQSPCCVDFFSRTFALTYNPTFDRWEQEEEVGTDGSPGYRYVSHTLGYAIPGDSCCPGLAVRFKAYCDDGSLAADEYAGGPVTQCPIFLDDSVSPWRAFFWYSAPTLYLYSWTFVSPVEDDYRAPKIDWGSGPEQAPSVISVTFTNTGAYNCIDDTGGGGTTYQLTYRNGAWQRLGLMPANCAGTDTGTGTSPGTGTGTGTGDGYGNDDPPLLYMAMPLYPYNLEVSYGVTTATAFLTIVTTTPWLATGTLAIGGLTFSVVASG